MPTLVLDPATLGDLEGDLDREWLVTNGLGGYALGSVCGATTRSYSGLLVAAVRPPVDRRVLVAKVDETVALADGTAVRLGTNEYADGTIHPRGFERLAAFVLEESVPRWNFRLAQGATLEKRVWMEHGRNLTFVQYRYIAVPEAGPIVLTLAPFCLDRDHHAYTHAPDAPPLDVDAAANTCAINATGGAPYHLLGNPAMRFTPGGDWNRDIFHRVERDRGLPAVEDVYVPGAFAVSLRPGETATLALSAEAALPTDLAGLGDAAHEPLTAAALERERARCRALLEQAGPRARSDHFFASLVLAADQFIVARPVDGDTAAEPLLTVIAGYPWFTDWGRDTMIALPGLTLVTGRHAEARGLLRTFARYTSQGMIPNRFPDAAAEPEYNTVDATLWYFAALDRYLAATGDVPLLEELFPLLDDIVSWHLRGTRFGIGVDPADGLLHAGSEGVQLTWMDARVDGWVVTPRSGKPVEINALWHNALRLTGDWARRLNRDTGRYDELRAAVERNFLPRFWYPAGGYLYDVVDADGMPGKLDWSLRPNQVIALAVAPSLIPDEQARAILAIVERTLLTPLGLRTLAPDDPRFRGTYGGDRRTRDAAYHQGTVWPWLLGPYADALSRLSGDPARLEALLFPFQAHLAHAGLGTVSEIAEAVPPFTSKGCLAQAWSVAELLRIAALVGGANG